MFKDTKMELAILEAKKAAKRDEVPVGALIEDCSGKILALEGNRCRQLNDPTAHAEMLAIRNACNVTNQLYLGDSTIYVTLEPCEMCAAAISAARISKVIFGASSTKYEGLQIERDDVRVSNLNKKLEIYGGFYEKEIISLMKKFFADKRVIKNGN